MAQILSSFSLLYILHLYTCNIQLLLVGTNGCDVILSSTCFTSKIIYIYLNKKKNIYKKTSSKLKKKKTKSNIYLNVVNNRKKQSTHQDKSYEPKLLCDCIISSYHVWKISAQSKTRKRVKCNLKDLITDNVQVKLNKSF